MSLPNTLVFASQVLTSLCALDFIIFAALYIFYLCCTFKTANKILVVCNIIVFTLFKIAHVPVFLEAAFITQSYFSIVLYTLLGINLTFTIVTVSAASVTLLRTASSSASSPGNYNHRFINIIIPIYNEDSSTLLRTLESIVNSNYTLPRVHVWMAFDDLEDSEGYTVLSQFLKEHQPTPLDSIQNEYLYKNTRISILRFLHGGKKSAQMGAYNLIRQRYTNLEESLLLFTDSDITLNVDALRFFNEEFNLTNKNVLTGLITCNASNFLTYFQDIEYVTGQIFWRNLEAYLGATTCLPGAFTMIKYNSFNNVQSEYFKKQKYDTLGYQRLYLGEDRYLTHLIMKTDPWSIGYCHKAKCQTEAPSTLKNLYHQRRRWFLGHISNDVYTITSRTIWKKYPMLSIFNFGNNMRNMGLYIYLLYFLVIQSRILTNILFIIVPFLINWIFIIVYSIQTKRLLAIPFYIIFILLQPIFNVSCMYYTIATSTRRTWGGVRMNSRPSSVAF